MARQFKVYGTQNMACRLVHAPPLHEAFGEEERIVQSSYRPRTILYDLPGTVNAEGVLPLLASLDEVFVPMKADRVVMESSLSFARSLDSGLVRNASFRLGSVRLFWTTIDLRERTSLYDCYEEVIHRLGLPLMATHVPYRSKFNRELLADGTGIGRSTLLAPEYTFACNNRDKPPFMRNTLFFNAPSVW